MLFLSIKPILVEASFSEPMAVVMATLCWMLFWWLFTSLPPALPALLPFVCFSIYEILPSVELASSVGSSTILLFLGVFMISAAIQKWGIHEDFAALFLRRGARSINSLLLSFILISACASMWISNTATVLILLPVIERLLRDQRHGPNERKILGLFMLAVAYASSIGGIATIIGSPPNAIAVSFLRHSGDTSLTFARWMRLALPLAAIGCTFLYFFFSWLIKRTQSDKTLEKRLMDSVEKILTESKSNARLTYEKACVLTVLLLCILAWLFLSTLKQLSGTSISEASIALLGGLALFVWPVKSSNEDRESGLLNAKDLQSLPWPTLFLFAGGLALSKGLQTSGWVEWGRNQLSVMPEIPPVAMLFSLVSSGVFLTEVMSNTALAALVVPWAASFQTILKLPLENLVLALCFASSLSFMMPVATPPNAIVFGKGYVPLKTMLRLGFVLNAFFIVLITGYVMWVLPWMT